MFKIKVKKISKEDRRIYTISSHRIPQANCFEGRKSARHQDDRRPTSHQKRRQSGPINFYEALMTASIRPTNKPAPLYEEDNGVHTIRIRALQHMTIIHLKRLLAREVAQMLDANRTSNDQMERVRTILEQYSKGAGAFALNYCADGRYASNGASRSEVHA